MKGEMTMKLRESSGLLSEAVVPGTEANFSRRRLIQLLGVGAAGMLLTGASRRAQAEEKEQVDAAIELLRSDVRSKHVEILTESLELTDAQSEAFWPVYKKYEAELTAIYDQRIALIKDYAANMDMMSDAKAKQTMETALKHEEQIVKLKRKYLKEFSKVVPAKTAARFVQVENQILRLIDLQIASDLPLIG
jgi:hypothetical protein